MASTGNVELQAGLPDLSHHLSQEARDRLPNTMKVFLRTVEDASQLVSLANGDPHPTLYPISQIDYHIPDLTSLDSLSSWLDHSGATRKLSAFNGTGECALDLAVAMQYSTGLGLPVLRQRFSEINELLHSPRPCTQNVILTLGNADGMTKLYRLLGSPGDTFLVEEYSFCGLTNAPLAQGVKWQPIKIDHMGLIPEEMEGILSSWDEGSMGRRPHVLYCIPTGQNPTGATLPVERRRAIYAIAQKYDVIILEDDPYYFLQYKQETSVVSTESPGQVSPDVISRFVKGTVPSFLSLDVDGRVIRCDSVSKTFAPNMRLGWITCNQLFCRKLEILTDNSTQHPHGLGQSLMAEVLAPTGWGVDGYIRWIWAMRNEYGRRRNIFFDIFQREVGRHGYAAATLPTAGMFFWVKVNIEKHPKYHVNDVSPKYGPKTNAKGLLDELFGLCVARGVLVMPGALFAIQTPTGSSENHILDRPYFRMTFVGVDETIEKGVTLFGKALLEFFSA
ncbi:hypothetical protein M422DRAFT_212501 [Sphaerobolus stellatus SS14]|uniref:Unplaced genomic scaffold SPHSTscaffold_110, whole genome shotgun sequence n=1 Tax=Sphaerobolus stellatus (strain SS14) TaxID=990650 RepID=A0A0C9TZ45_SPHS4|nr:hypothetical protein M422DRAFT_216290 [Sphaerobolus stellatus SS14]KIJ35723.1 hypothetical protein M422DRAFT_212501 [Sphaerobolus stellatus SS14]